MNLSKNGKKTIRYNIARIQHLYIRVCKVFDKKRKQTVMGVIGG